MHTNELQCKLALGVMLTACTNNTYMYARRVFFMHGATSWTDWIKHCEAVAVLNDWDDAAKLSWLPVRLSGKAHTAWKRLSP